MRILLCNPQNSQGTTHSRKGMYAPLGLLSIATVLEQELGDQVSLTVWDEDVELVDPAGFGAFDLVGFYATTFNYRTSIEYATLAKSLGCTTVLGGPHSTILATQILNNRTCFDYVIKFEAERSMVGLVRHLMNPDSQKKNEIPNLVYKNKGILHTGVYFENNLAELPVISRKYVPFDKYIDNYTRMYPERKKMRIGSLYSSKGCAWRDKTPGCAFCARVEEGVRFREIDQIWEEIRYLKDECGVNCIWDISDDNLNVPPWFKAFVDARPKDCEDMTFFIYSRVSFIRPDVIPYFHRLNVEEIFLGVESGDNKILKNTFKGQSAKMALNSCTLLAENGIKYFPSFILGLPGESETSMENTRILVEQLADLGGLDRMGLTILQPIPGSPAFNQMLTLPQCEHLKETDDIDLKGLEEIWVNNFTDTTYDVVREYRDKINGAVKGLKVFGAQKAS